MPDIGLQPPYLDPSQFPSYLDAQRKQMVAQALMGAFQQASQTPSDWNSMRVVPKRSPLTNIATLATALMAPKATRDAQSAEAKYFGGLYGGGEGAQPSSGTPGPSLAPPPADPNEQSVQPLIARNGQSFSQAVGGGAPTRPNPMLLTGDPHTSQPLLSMMGPQKYGEALAARYQPLELEKKLTLAGITDPGLRQQIIQASLAKDNYIAPVGGARPGTVAFDPVTHQPLFAQPDVGHNVNLNVGPGGHISTAPIPGNAAAQGQLEGAQTAAKVANTPMTVPTGGGGSAVGYPGNLIGQPPAMGGASPAVAANAQPSVPRGTSTPNITNSTSSQNTPDPWTSMPKLPISNAVGAPNAFVEGRLKAAGAKDAELSSQYGHEADLADQKLQYNTEARKAIGNAETGPSSEWLTENRAKLLEWGVPESLVPGSEKVTATQELNKNLKQSALQGARAIFGSRMTQMEVRLQHEELSPSTSMTKDAIESLMQQDDIKQQYAKQRSQDYGKYIQQGGDPLRFESWYSKNFPLTKFAQQQVKTVEPQKTAPTSQSQAPASAIAYLKQHPELKEAFRQKYGYVP